MTVIDLLLILGLTFINYALAKKMLYKIYYILIADRTFVNAPEKVGFYIHGWSAYIGLVSLVTMPLWVQNWERGLMGTGFVLILRVLLKNKV